MGRRGANQLAVISAGIGTLACGLSQNMEMLIVARFVSSRYTMYKLIKVNDCLIVCQLGGLGGEGIFTTSQ